VPPFRPPVAALPFLALLGSNACGGTASSAASHDAATHDTGTLSFPDASRDSAHPHPVADAGHDSSPVDSGTDVDLGSLSTTYPAFTPDLPQIVANEGTVLASPVIVTITWPASDLDATTWEAMGDAIGSSSYWKSTTGPYGVGPATSGDVNHVHMTKALPASLSYTDLDNYVLAAVTATMVDAGSAPDAGTPDGGDDASAPNPRWPAPTISAGNAQTVYSLFIPQSVSVTDPGSGASFCDEGGLGYHANVTIGSQSFAYSVSLECAGQTLPDLEETVAHEYVEAVTNPYPNTMTIGYVGFDANHLSWDIYTGFNDELADGCQNWADSYYQESSAFPYWVQRTWSNTSGAAGHDPCVPVPTGAYEGLTLFPSQQTLATINLTSIGFSKETTRVFAAKVGQTVTFDVGFYSDAQTSGPWTISYDFPATTQLFDASGNPLGNGTATVTLDRTSGANGEKALVSVTPTMAGPLGFQVMAITWAPPTGAAAALYLPHYLPLLISN